MLYRCVFGPHLQRIHRSPDQSRPEGRLTRRVRVDVFRAVLEQLNADTDFYIGFNRFGYICSSKLVPVSQYVGTVLVCLLGVACLRGWGRWKNSDYVQFISVLEETKKNHTPANKKKLRCYDFDFSHWPSDFSWTEVSSPKQSKGGVSLLKPDPRLRGTADSFLNSVRTLPCHVIGYV
ncbi:hypothetical protein XENORESO_005690 [Xenotaenia resolanae]|uniref:Phosphatidylserine Lipase ABHD16 N-terminal domain-containing protein n=1 Tax=Xenotaenia resolanae TaxID=208358 RepID=A0ABV0WLD0_9TELE